MNTTPTIGARHLRAASAASWALLLPALAGCLAGVSTHVSEPVQPATSISVVRLAVMPVTMEMGTEGFRPEVVSGLLSSLRDHFPDVGVLGPDDVGELLASGPSAAEYARLAEDFARTGIVESDRLGRLTAELGVTHFLQLHAGYAKEEFLDTHASFDFHAQEEKQEIVAVARLWGAAGPGPAWEAVARTTSRTSTLTRRRPPSDLVGDMVASLVARMPLEGARAPGR
jgi:hypothetical protein